MKMSERLLIVVLAFGFTVGLSSAGIERVAADSPSIACRESHITSTNKKGDLKVPENFDSMPLAEKREWMLKDFTEKINERVKSGKISREDGDKKIEFMKEHISNWDGILHKTEKH